MSLILPVHVILSIIFLQAICITSLPEEAFLSYPMQNDEEYLYLDNRGDPAYAAASAIKQSETRRRSILDKNFARFGRSGNYNTPKSKMLSLNNDPDMKNIIYVNDDDVDAGPFARSARSGERSDQFIRFGRGKSDFVRFGRADGGYQRNRDFIRFGRSIRSAKNIKDNGQHPPNEKASRVGKMAAGYKMADGRKKRSANLDFYKKGGSNFVRFGRDRNENFMRFGRMMNANYLPGNQNTNLNAGLANPASTSASGGASLNGGPNADKSYNNTGGLKNYLEELQAQQGHEIILRMLMDLLAKSHQLQQLHKTMQETAEKNQQNVKQDMNRCY